MCLLAAALTALQEAVKPYLVLTKCKVGDEHVTGYPAGKGNLGRDKLLEGTSVVRSD